MIDPSREPIGSALDTLRENGIESGELLITMGSGQSNPWSDKVTAQVSYSQLSGWQAPSVEGHGGRLGLIEIGGENVLVMEGRHHYYEARSYEGVLAPLSVMYALGVRKALLTNSVGALRSGMRQGDLVLLSDHILFQGPELGTILQSRWPDGVRPRYWEEGREAVKRAAGRAGVPLTEGVLLCVPGPMYETRAEAEMARRMGADVVAMSLAPEALAGMALGYRVVGLSLVTNLVGGEGHAELRHEEVISTAGKYQPSLDKLLAEAVPALLAASG